MPYHADVIGSLLRPRYLSEARAALAAGRMSNEEFKRIEDRAVDQVIAMQEGCGLDVVNDGELRRFSFLDHLLGDMEGLADIPGATIRFHAADPAQDWEWQPPVTVTGRIRSKGPMMTIEEFSYARGRARVPVKITMPSPLVIYSAWSPEHSRPAYSDPFEMFADAAALLSAEIAQLAALGCGYVQIDAPELATLVDESVRAGFSARGIDPDRLLGDGVDILNDVATTPGVRHALHLCRGNRDGHWMAAGGYEKISKQVFRRVTRFDAFFLEYDDERSGGFEPLADIPRDRFVFLGLVSTKRPALERPDQLLSQIEEAAQFYPRDQLGLCPQCGFSSAIGSYPLDAVQQQRKLRLVSDVARLAWPV